MSLVSDLVLALDPTALMEKLGLKPDPWQVELLRDEPHRAIVCCSRQSGKSTVASICALHQALYRGPSLTLLLSPSLRQSSELFRKVIGFFHRLEGAGDPAQESTLRLELRNGSRVISLPGSETTTRGFSAADLVIADEAARIDDALLAAVTPALATTNGRLIALSTPCGRRGWFHSAWEHGGDSWTRFMLKASDCPRISPEFLEEERRQHGEWIYSQEYECQFLEEQTAVFTSALIESALTNEVQPLWQ